MILLGWEIGTGRRVEIPETGHLAWFGQTQLSGKTTALEAIAYRGELRAVAFITKQGEGGFLTGRMIPPYFSEPTNDEEQPLWRWVKSILEASQQRKLNFEEAWIIRCCEDPRSAKTLKDVHENIKALLGGEGGYIEKGRGKKKKKEWKYTRKPVSGINAGVYTSLKAYFDIVMPQLARLPYTKKLALGDGLNVMDLREYAMETQALVIRSVMEWVYQHEKGVRVIVPEAQDFVPQGKNSPVKMACETLVRKAGANRNFMWLDSQDMAAVDKIMLRACSIVGIGVQTEGHEIERSLAGLFTPALKPVDIARLKIGEFFVRTPEARVQKCYVQPAWMESELHAQAIAKGEERVESARQMLRAFKDRQELESAIEFAFGVADHVKRMPGPPQLKQILSQESPADESDSEKSDADISIEKDHVEEIPPPQILNETEPGKYEIQTEDPGDPCIAGSPERTESASENPPLHKAVPGTSLRSQRGANAPGSEYPMPETPLEKVKRFLDMGVQEIPTRSLDQALRDLLKDHAALIEAHDALAARVQKFDPYTPNPVHPSQSSGQASPPESNGHGLRFTVPDLDYIYGYVKSRAAVDPTILEILTHRPEIRVKVERQVIHANGNTLDGRVALLVHEGFFDKPKTRVDVGNELRRRGALESKANLKILSPRLSSLAEKGFLTIEGDAYKSVPEMKAQIAKGDAGLAIRGD
jgi:hypothetical protein